jgi:hypothetical protein
MPMNSRGPGRFLVALVALLAVAGCGTPSGDNSCKQGQKGCVDLLNFTGSPVSIAPPGQSNAVPARTVTSTIAPGTGSLMVSGTAVGSSTTFQAMANGNVLKTVTCTVTSMAWADVNPEVVLQQTGSLTCVDW